MNCKFRSILVALSMAPLLVSISFTWQAKAESSRIVEELLAYDLPEATEFEPVYPEVEKSALATFRVRLHKDFSEVLRSDVATQDGELLGAYLDVRDQWLRSGKLVKTVLAGYITMAVDAYLVRALYDSRTSADILRPLALRNNLSGRGYFTAMDTALQNFGSHHKSLAEICENERVMPREACWLAYVQQFGLSYTQESFENVNIRFLDAELGQVQNPLGRLGMFEEMTRNPVFVLHGRRPSLAIQFSAHVVDGGRIRRIFWQQNADRTTELDKNEQDERDGSYLNSLAQAGDRWLASESYTDNAEVNMTLFYRKCKIGSRTSDFSEPIHESAEALFGQYMAVLQDTQ